MTPEQERLIALAGVFEAAALVDRLAKTGQVQVGPLACLLGSLLVLDPNDTLEVYGGDHLNLRDGLRALAGALERTPGNLPRESLRYALALLTLQGQLDKRSDMLQVIGNRLQQIDSQSQMFGVTHDNVISACAALYQDTLSTFRQRIQVHGEMQHLQNSRNAEKIRALLLAGIRSAMLWRQLGGHRWQLLISRRKLLDQLYPLLRD